MADEAPIPITRAEYAAQFGAAPASAPIPISRAEYAAQFGSVPGSASQGGLSALGEIGQGLTFGFQDELEGGMSATGQLLASIFGGGNGRTFGENYAARRDATRAELGQFEKENPWGSIGLQVVGGAIPAVAGGVARAGFGAAEAGAGALSRLARNVFGIGMKESPTLLQLAKMGGIQGSLYGAGNADEGSRIEGALTGAPIGAVAAPVFGKTIETGVNLIGDLLANLGLLKPGMLAAERGAIGGPAVDKLTPEEIFVAKQLKNTPVEKVVAGSHEMASAISDDIPLFLPEALGSPKVDRNARFVANYEPSMEMSQSAIGARTSTAEERVNKLLDIMAPNEGPYEGATKMAAAADDIIKTAEGTRKELVDPLYRAAYDEVPTIDSSDLTALLEKDSRLKQAIASVKKTAKWADAPENSTELLVRARREIGDQIEGAITAQRPRLAEDLTDTYNQLNGILHKNKTLSQADFVFGNESAKIEELTGSFLKKLQNFSADKVQNVGQLFTLPAERISALRQQFQKAGKIDSWNAGIRAHLQGIAEGTRDGTNFTRKMIGSTTLDDKLKAALGSSYEDVAKGLSYENRFFEGKNKYHAGSSTAGNLAEASEFEKGIGLLSKIAENDWGGAIASLFKGDMPEEVAQGLAKIYFDPQQGYRSINKIIPLLEQYSRNKAFSTLTGNVTAGATTRAGVDELAKPLQQPGSQASETRSPQSIANLLERVTQGKPKSDPSLDRISYSDATQEFPAFNAIFKTGGKMESVPTMQVIEEIKKNPVDHAIMLMESNGDPKAKNPTSSASGLFQLIKSTAKNLGVKDVFNAAENYEGFKKLKEDTIKQFGTDDVRMIYASHYLGAPTLRKWLQGEELTATQRAQVKELETKLLPKLDRIYNRLIKNEVVEA